MTGACCLHCADFIGKSDEGVLRGNRPPFVARLIQCGFLFGPIFDPSFENQAATFLGRSLGLELLLVPDKFPFGQGLEVGACGFVELGNE